MRILLIRHGRQDSPLCNVNVPLSVEGRRQAELLGERLEKEDIDAIWSSNLIRAVETADIINEKIHAPRIIRENLKEISLVIWKDFLMRSSQTVLKISFEEEQRWNVTWLIRVVNVLPM